MAAPTTSIVDTYLDAIQSHDWDRLRACVTDDIVRTGPYGDVYRGRDDYVAYISTLMPTLPNYKMDVARITVDGSRTFVELSETVGDSITNEVLVLVLDGDLIAQIDIYIQRTPA